MVATVCTPGQVESLCVRITVVQRKGKAEVEIGRATVAVVEMLDPKRRAGSGGGGGAFEVEIRDERAGNVSCAAGVLEIRAVVAGRRRREVGRVCMMRELGLGVEVCCGIAVRREVKGVFLRVSRKGGGRQMLPMADMKVGAGGVGYGMAVIGRGLLWFGVGEGSIGEMEIRLEWWRMWGMFVGRRHVVGRLDVGMKELEEMRRGELKKVCWQVAPGERTVTRLVFFDEVVRDRDRFWMKLRLTQ